jgi:hypothetical protein
MNFTLTMIGLASAIIAAAPLWVEVATDPINAANFARIKTGMSRAEVEKILGGPGEEFPGERVDLSLSWQGRGRNIIIVNFQRAKEGGWRAANLRIYFNPSVWERINEWWGGYQLEPDGGRTKRLKGAA